MRNKNKTQDNLKLQQTVRFFETLLRASADGIVITDPAKNIIFVNDTFCKIFSSNRQDVIETNLFVWLAKLDTNAMDIWNGLETRINEHGIARDVEFAMKTEEGMRYFSVNSSLLEKIDIEETGLIISIWRDDTERKITKEALLQANYELESRVIERTAQLTTANIELRNQINERKKTQEALGESEELYRTIVEYSNDMIWTLDTEGKFLFFNKRAEKISGYKLDNWLGKSFAPLVIKEDLPKVIDVFQNTLKGRPRQYEVRFTAKNGTIVTLEGNSAPIYSKGKVVGTVTLGRDITERKRVEEELRESQSLLFNAFNNSPLMMTISDIATGKYLEVNDSFCRISGFSRDEAIGKTSIEIGWIDEKERIRMVHELQQNGKVSGLELTLRSKGGKKIICRYSGDIIQTAQGNKLFSAAEDITRRKQIEDELAKNREMLIKAEEIGHLGSWDWVLATNELVWSREVYNIYGLDPGIYKPDYELVINTLAPECKDDFLKAIDDTLKLRKPFEGEYRIILPDGTIKFTHTKGEVVYDNEGNPIRIYGIVQDITERKLAEEEARLNSEIFKNVSEGIFLLGMDDGLIKHANSKFEEMFGYEPGEMIGKDVSMLNAPTDKTPQETKTDIMEILKHAGEWHGEIRNIRKDGTIFWSYSNVSLFDHPEYGRVIVSVHTDITDRKQAELEREQFFKFFNISNDIMVIADPNGAFKKVNPVCLQMLGYSESELLAKPFIDFIYPDDRQSTLDEMAKQIKLGFTLIFDNRYLCKDGTVRWLSWRANYDKGEGLTYATARDVTERKQAEEKIREITERLAMAQEAGKIGTFDWYIQENKTIWTDQMEAMYGLPPGGFGGGNEEWEKTIHPDDHDLVMAHAAMAMSEKKDIEIEYRIIWPDGSVHWILDKARIIYSDSGEPLRMVGVNIDITERKQAEEKLRKSEELFRKLVEAEPECVKLLTKDNILVDMNPAGLRMIEADSREQVIGRSVLGIVDREYREPFVDIVKRVFNGESALLEFSITGLKGTKRWLETHAVPLRDDNGKINLLISVTRDITERKHAQEERFTLVAREQAALAEAQAAKKLDRMKSMFIASTSHELRTPLNSIIGFTSLMLDGSSGELTPDQKEQLSIVHSSGKHLLALINDIIDLSMIEAGRLKVVVSEFDLEQVVNEAVSNVNVSLGEKKLELKIDLSYIRMRSDRTRILQCLINLLSNAIKYTEKGSVKITAKVVDNNVELSVTDTGIGIKAEDIPKLFGPFLRLQSPLSLRTSGTGLGLYLIKKLARDFLGGDVEVKSEFGKGSTFTLRVPVELEE